VNHAILVTFYLIEYDCLWIRTRLCYNLRQRPGGPAAPDRRRVWCQGLQTRRI